IRATPNSHRPDWPATLPTAGQESGPTDYRTSANLPHLTCFPNLLYGRANLLPAGMNTTSPPSAGGGGPAGWSVLTVRAAGAGEETSSPGECRMSCVGIEQLESRNLMSTAPSAPVAPLPTAVLVGPVLTITGTGEADTVVVGLGADKNSVV